MANASEQTLQFYDYVPIQRNQVRILLLQPSITWESSIECSLQTIALETWSVEQAPDGYEALSYCWGESSKSEPHYICCHDKQLEVRKNLHLALRRLRLQQGIRRLWIDAICINQHDLDERSNQVAMMARIFTLATQTVIWLGEDSEDRDGALSIEFFTRGRVVLDASTNVDDYVIAEAPDWFNEHDHREYAKRKRLSTICENVFGFRPKHTDSYITPFIYGNCPHPLVAFLRRSWFGRLWIVQELHCSRYAVIMCGHHTVPWQDVRDVFRAFYGLNILYEQDYIFHSFLNTVDLSIRKACRLFLTTMSDEAEYTAGVEYMEKFHDFGCKDDRDRVYALLAVCKLTLTPNYRLSAERIYRDFAESCVQAGYTRWLLECASRRLQFEAGHGSPTLPSWVPDWRLFADWTDQTGQIDKLRPLINRPRAVEAKLHEVLVQGGRGLLISARVNLIGRMPSFTPKLVNNVRRLGLQWTSKASLPQTNTCEKANVVPAEGMDLAATLTGTEWHLKLCPVPYKRVPPPHWAPRVRIVGATFGQRQSRNVKTLAAADICTLIFSGLMEPKTDEGQDTGASAEGSKRPFQLSSWDVAYSSSEARLLVV